MTEAERKQEISDKLGVIVEAYNIGQIAIKKCLTYRGKLAPKGHSFFTIKYVSEDTIVYEGAYRLKYEAETKLGDQVINFILFQLATQL